MKTNYKVFILNCCLFMTFMTSVMGTIYPTEEKAQDTEKQSQSHEEQDIERGRTIVRKTRQVAAIGSIAGGWGFAMATAWRFATLPYGIRRFPLMVFLTANTLGQLPNALNIDNNPRRLASLGRACTFTQEARGGLSRA